MERGQNCKYWAIHKFSLRYSHYAIIDTTDQLVAKHFTSEGIHMWFGREFVYPQTPYRMVACRCRRRDSKRFEAAMEALPRKMLLCGYTDYIGFCQEINHQVKLAQS